jgi:NAD(P)-dependent dehydrogenase (short-subunit alcohol dehydrogenase family)
MVPSFGYHTTGAEVVQAFPGQVEERTCQHLHPWKKPQLTISVLITGPSAGSLGAKTATLLATAKPSKIILLGRTLSKVQPVIDEIRELSPSTLTPFIQINLSDFDSVRKAAAEVYKVTAHIDVLLNNAGIMALHDFQKSISGIEMQFATNHLGPFLLTKLLLPLLLASSTQPRIVNVSSAGHALGPVRFEDYNFSDGAAYDEWEGYGQGKCGNVLFARSLASKLSRKVSAFSLHPGNIFGTGLGANLVDPDWPYLMGLFDKAGRKPPGLKTIEEGVSTILAACLDERLEGDSGAYLDDCGVSDSTAFSSDMGNAERLWKLSEELVGEKFVI